LPASIGDLSRLSHFKLHNNYLTCLPEEIGDLYALDLLDLSHNRLHEIPERLYELPRLTYLLLTGNPLTTAQISEIRGKMKKTKVIFES
jgi:Leucine-rich repeat (LRR) protein